MRLLKTEIDKRLLLTVDKKITAEGVHGILNYGANNDYPQLMERLASSSITAKSVSDIYSKFLTGQGFKNEVINNEIVGYTDQGKEITVKTLLRQVSQSIAIFNGVYIHCNLTIGGQVQNCRLVPFKYCRFSAPDDILYSAKVGVHTDWAKENTQKKFKNNEIAWYPVFNLKPEVLLSEIQNAGGIENFKGQVYYSFFDQQFQYPLSVFDCVYLDCDSEYQLSMFKNRQLRNGMLDKTVFRILPSKNEIEKQELADGIKSFMGVDGETVLIVEDEINQDTGEVKQNGSMIIDKIPTNINDKLFESWQKELTNNIRKSVKALPAVLIDYEESKLGTTSGEAIIQATNYYNAVTRDDRNNISNIFREIFTNSVNPVLAGNQDWSISEISLYTSEVKVEQNQAEQLKIEAQNTLKGSVGGVQALVTLQQSVAQGTTKPESAVAIIEEIYGIPENIARKMIGIDQPKINRDGTTNI